jgi:hypothetical protein
MANFRLLWLFPAVVAGLIASPVVSAAAEAGNISGRRGVYQWARASSMEELITHSIEIVKRLEKQGKKGKPKHCVIMFCSCLKDSDTILYLKYVVDASRKVDDRDLSEDMEARLRRVCTTQDDCGGCVEESIRSIRLRGSPEKE